MERDGGFTNEFTGGRGRTGGNHRGKGWPVAVKKE